MGVIAINDLTSGMTGGSLQVNFHRTVGEAGTGRFVQSGGIATISDPAFGVPGALMLGYQAGDSGSYSLSGNSQLYALPEYVGYFGTGSFTQLGGTNTVVFSSSPTSLFVGYGSGSTGTYNLSGTGLLVDNYGDVGESGTGTFNQSGGTHSSLHVVIADQAGSTGTYNLNGGLLIASSISRGAGAATFNFNGGTIQASGSFSSNLPMALGGGATFDTAGNAVTLAGSFSGAGGLTKSDSGTLILATTNTFSGNTLISGGTLALGNRLALQKSTLDTSGSGTLSFGTLAAATVGGLSGPGTLNLANSRSIAVALSLGNNGTSTSFSGTLTGPGSLTKIGSGTLLLGGINSYSGSTTISQGKLIVNGSIVSPITVNNGGVLGGTGTVAAVTVNAGGQLAPGDAPGTLYVGGSLTLMPSAVMDYELGSLTNADEISMPMPGGTLNLNGQQFSDFNFTPLAGFEPGEYTLIGAGSINGTLGANTSGTVDGLMATIAIDGNNVVLTVVPEPPSIALVLAAAAGVIAWSWRRPLNVSPPP